MATKTMMLPSSAAEALFFEKNKINKEKREM